MSHIGRDFIKYLKAACQGDSQTLLMVPSDRTRQEAQSEIEEAASEHQ